VQGTEIPLYESRAVKFSFPRSARERPRKLSFFKKLSLLLSVLNRGGRGASGLHSHAERGNEKKTPA